VLVTPHPLYLALASDGDTRRATYRALFQSALADAPLAELRMVLNQDQPIGNDRFYPKIEATTGQRRELRKRGRPRKKLDEEPAVSDEQRNLPL
jgi:putative transposase